MITLNQPFRAERAGAYVAEALAAGHLAGDGPFTVRCQRLLQEITHSPRVLLTTSCTHALEMAALLLDIAPGDEVIVPSFTFVSTVNAFVLRGARPVFVDVEPDTLNMNPDLVAKAVTERTRAIVPVHYAGVACDMDRIGAVAAANGVTMVEDNAHGLLGTYRGRPLGSIGALAALSFHETKNFTCGEGGALLINDSRFVERAEILREKGTQRSRFFRGEIDKYTWCDLGSSYLPSDVLAALLLAQLESRTEIQRIRRHIWDLYMSRLAAWATCEGVALPSVPADVTQAYHMFYVVMPSPASREALTAHLKARGIMAVFHYLPLHLSPMGLSLGGRPGDCPVTESVSDCLLRLPFHTGLTEGDLDAVVGAVTEFRASAAKS